MFCQQKHQMMRKAVSCDVMVNGLPNINIESGIIGSHTFCNEESGFCELTDAGGDIEATVPVQHLAVRGAVYSGTIRP